MTEKQEAEIRLILEKHLEKAIEEIVDTEANECLGYYPDNMDAFADAVIVVLKHQAAIQKYHQKEGTKFE